MFLFGISNNEKKLKNGNTEKCGRIQLQFLKKGNPHCWEELPP